MLGAITNLALRRPKTVLAFALALVPVLVVAGGGVAARLSVGGFADADAESARAEVLLDEVFDAGPTNYLLLVTAKTGRVESPENAEAGRALTAAVAAEPGVDEVVSFWALTDTVPNLQNPLRSLDGTQAVISARLGGNPDVQRETAERLERFATATDRFTIEAGGAVEISRQTAEQAEADLRLAELIVTPLTLGALLVVFRGWRAAALPLGVAIVAVLGTFVVLSALTLLTDVSTFALNLTTALGLGLAVDYSLLIVARYREELAAGHDRAIALHRTMQTAARTVVFSGATVATSMLSLLVFPVPYLRSFAFAGVAVVATACGAAILLLPALLAWIGPRIGTAAADAAAAGFWRRQASRVVARPWPWALGVAALLVAAGLPFLAINPSRIDDRVLPPGAGAREVADELRAGFDFAGLNGVAVVAPGVDAADTELIRAYEQVISRIDGVERVDSVAGSLVGDRRLPPEPGLSERFEGGDATWFNVTLADDPESAAAEATVAEIRDGLDRFDTPVLVAGATAATVDTVAGVTARLPLALGIVAVVTLALLYLMTGSVVVPLKALALNLLSLTATFGALVWVFQDGHLASWLGVTAVGSIDVFTPILMFCIAFGLSMDYEVFLLSRIKEEYDLTGDNDAAVITGIAHTGRLVTAAAVLLAIVFVAIAFSGVTVVKMFGVGLAIAVLVDAFLVRATLTPALMRLAGRSNWWAPRPLRLFHLRYGLWENDPVTLPDPPTPPTPPTQPTPSTLEARS